MCRTVWYLHFFFFPPTNQSSGVTAHLPAHKHALFRGKHYRPYLNLLPSLLPLHPPPNGTKQAATSMQISQPYRTGEGGAVLKRKAGRAKRRGICLNMHPANADGPIRRILVTASHNPSRSPRRLGESWVNKRSKEKKTKKNRTHEVKLLSSTLLFLCFYWWLPLFTIVILFFFIFFTWVF